MYWQPDEREFEPTDNSYQNPIPVQYFTGLYGMRVLNLSPYKTETGGIHRSPVKVDWENMVDAIYAAKDKFSSN